MRWFTLRTAEDIFHAGQDALDVAMPVGLDEGGGFIECQAVQAAGSDTAKHFAQLVSPGIRGAENAVEIWTQHGLDTAGIGMCDRLIETAGGLVHVFQGDGVDDALLDPAVPVPFDVQHRAAAGCSEHGNAYMVLEFSAGVVYATGGAR